MAISRTLKKISQILEARLPNGTVVLRPDHPFMLDGPDILAGASGTLLCIFKSRRNETVGRRNKRLMVSRMLLPKAACVLLSEDEESSLYDLVVKSGEEQIADVLLKAMSAGPLDGHHSLRYFGTGILEEAEASMARHPYGGHLILSEDWCDIGGDQFRLVRVNHGPDDWLDAVAMANRFEGRTVIPSSEPLLVALVDSWTGNKEMLRAYAYNGILGYSDYCVDLACLDLMRTFG